MSEPETKQTWDFTDYVEPDISHLKTGNYTVFLEQIQETDLIDQFRSEISNDRVKSQILDRILALKDRHPGLDKQTRLILTVDDTGNRKIVGMDWIGFIGETFFVTPPVFCACADERITSLFRDQAMEQAQRMKPERLTISSISHFIKNDQPEYA